MLLTAGPAAASALITGAESVLFTTFLGTDAINLDIHGFDPAGPAGNLNAVRHFATADDLRAEIVNARVGDIIQGKFILRTIGIESVEIAFTGFPPDKRAWLKPGDRVVTSIEKLGDLAFTLT